jgi:hypothetical protein
LDVRVRGAVDPDIQQSQSFAEWEAAVASGATLNELEKLENGGYSKTFRAKMLAWHKLHKAVEMHSEAEAVKAAERASKAKG